MISKELLNEVLEYNIGIVSDMIVNNNAIEYSIKNGSMVNFINIYELAHKCKEWALNKKYYINSELDCDSSVAQVCKLRMKSRRFIGRKTEPEAIFEACQWILDNETTKQE